MSSPGEFLETGPLEISFDGTESSLEPVPPPPPKGSKVCNWPGCERGGRPFGAPALLMRHWTAVHAKTKDFKCNQCGAAFAHSGALKTHVNGVHLKEFKVCEHDKRKGSCLVCTGCPHGKRVARCSECGGSQLCSHGKSECKDCKHGLGTRCSHGNRPDRCVKCGTAKQCEHGKRKWRCSKCNPCPHQRVASLCAECRGGVLHQCIGLEDEKGCVNGRRSHQSDGKYGKRCVRCFIATFPKDTRAIEAKKWLNAKEITVREFLATAFPDHRWTFDRSFSIGVRQRPDARLAASKHSVILVEIDEKSHDVYDCAEERERERIFAQHVPKAATIVLIRFNPDAYDDVVTGQRIPSCFRYSKELRLVSVNSERQEDWDMRLAVLKSWIEHFLEHPPGLFRPEDEDAPEHGDDRYKYVFPIELFYDNVRAKWPNGKNVDRVKAKKTIGKRRKRETEVATVKAKVQSTVGPSTAGPSCSYTLFESSDSSDED